MNRFAPIVFACLAIMAPGMTQAQAPLGESARGMLGPWEFSNADRDRRCTATFRNTAAAAGFKVEFDANCVNLFPIVARIAGWRFPEGDNLFMIDTDGKTLAEFSEVESGIFEAPTPGVGVLFLQSAAAAAPAAKTPDDLAGDWIIMGADALCELTLANRPSGNGLSLAVKPGCKAEVAKLNFARWRIENSELLLIPAQGQPWRFAESDNDTWRRLAGGADAVTLVRR